MLNTPSPHNFTINSNNNLIRHMKSKWLFMIISSLKFLPKPIKIIGNYILNSEHQNRNLRSQLFPYKDYSQFSIYSPNFYKNYFIAENILGIINRNEVDIQ